MSAGFVTISRFSYEHHSSSLISEAAGVFCFVFCFFFFLKESFWVFFFPPKATLYNMGVLKVGLTFSRYSFKVLNMNSEQKVYLEHYPVGPCFQAS